MKKIDLKGERFGRLVVLYQDTNSKRVKWVCRCDCGKEKSIFRESLRRGLTSSCGCLNAELARERMKKNRGLYSGNKTHGHTCGKINGLPVSGTYQTWSVMKARCNNKKHEKYKYYGGKGVSYCSRWKSFEKFLEDMGERPEGKSLDRIDNSKDYSPENCRWATPEEQQQNKTEKVFILINGELKPLAETARKENIKYKDLYNKGKRNNLLVKKKSADTITDTIF